MRGAGDLSRSGSALRRGDGELHPLDHDVRPWPDADRISSAKLRDTQSRMKLVGASNRATPSADASSVSGSIQVVKLFLPTVLRSSSRTRPQEFSVIWSLPTSSCHCPARAACADTSAFRGDPSCPPPTQQRSSPRSIAPALAASNGKRGCSGHGSGRHSRLCSAGPHGKLPASEPNPARRTDRRAFRASAGCSSASTRELPHVPPRRCESPGR